MATACIRLGSKADMFHLEGKTWLCTTGLPSDVIIEVGNMSFHLHKFPLLSKSGLLEKLIQESSTKHENKEETKCVFSLDDLPGGSISFLLIAKFCYDIKVELTASNIVNLLCASQYLQMTEDYGEQNLISQTEAFLNNEVLTSWADTIKALQTCHAMLLISEELHIISRCIDSLTTKAIAGTTPDSWYDDVAVLEMPLFKRLISSFASKGMGPGKIAGSVMSYAKKRLPLNGRQMGCQKPVSRKPVLSDMDQRALVEEIVELLPDQRGDNQIGPTFTTFLLKLLKISMILNASDSARDSLERRIGARLEEAGLQDLFIPNMGYNMETLYDIECVQRIVEHFLLMRQEDSNSKLSDELVECSRSLKPMTMVVNLLDNYLAEVASDVNLKLEKFLLLADAIPGCSRPLDDGIYRAIDVYLKAHPSLTDSEREHLCRLMNYQNLSLEAITHAAHNERLPLRAVVQILFLQQLKLRTSVAGWLFVSDNLDTSENLSGPHRNEPVTAGGGEMTVTFDDVKGRVRELEKECESMKQEIEKIVKSKGRWSNLCRKLGVGSFKAKSMLSCDGEALQPSRKAVLNRKND